MMDPPKKGVAEAIETLKVAGIRVFMVTGDHPFTAEAIAKKVGILKECKTREDLSIERKCRIEDVDESEANAAVIYGPDLIAYTEEMWTNLITTKLEIVFARISPQ